MSDRYGSYPPDEPIIGVDYPPAPQPSSQPQADIIGAGEPWAGASASPAARAGETQTEWADDEAGYDEDSEDDFDDDEYYEDDYYDESPARQPIFYVFIALAILIGGGLIFVLFSVFGGNDGPDVAAGFRVRIDAPANSERIEIGKPEEVVVQATSTEQITRFELFVADQLSDQVNVTEPGANGVYSAVLKHTFDRTGEFGLFVRVTSVSGATQDSDRVTVVAIQPVGDKPVQIKGKIIGQTSVRHGPGDSFEVVRTLNPGEEVNILAKTRDGSWLLIDVGDGWVRKEAVDPLESLALVPVKDPTPTPAPPTPTETEEPSPTASPTTNPNAPDFVPNNAILIDGGTTLRVTVINLSTNAYNGPLVVGVANVSATSPQVAVDARIPANGSTTVDFELDPPITEPGSSAQVTIDPGNAVKESNEDNNAATFTLTPAAEAPNLKILVPSYQGNDMNVTVRNDGGELKSSSITVRVESGGSASEQNTTAALAKGQSLNFSLPRPAAGPAKIRVYVNGEQVSAADVEVP